MGAVWAVMHVFPLFPLDGAKSARFQAQMTFLTQAPSCDRGVFHHGQAERQLVLAAVLRPPEATRLLRSDRLVINTEVCERVYDGHHLPK